MPSKNVFFLSQAAAAPPALCDKAVHRALRWELKSIYNFITNNSMIPISKYQTTLLVRTPIVSKYLYILIMFITDGWMSKYCILNSKNTALYRRVFDKVSTFMKD